MDMESLRKKTVYLETLENLFQELVKARSVSSGGRKLMLLGLLYDVHRVHRFFMQIENNLSESMDIHNLLLYDADVDYHAWSIRLDIKFDVSPFYMPDEEDEDADAASVKETLWHILNTFSRKELKGISLDRNGYMRHLKGILVNGINTDRLALVLNASIVSLRESLLHIHTCISRHRMNLEEGEALYRHERDIFLQRYESGVIEEFEAWKDACDEDEEVIRRNLKGKYCTEMLAFFMSGFLSPRIGSQAETDTTEFDAEYEDLRFFNVPPSMEAKAYYSALRELFEYRGRVVVPKKGHIGKYFFKHRKEVDAGQRLALFKFIKMVSLVENEKKPKTKAVELNYEGIKIAMARTYFPKCTDALAEGYSTEWLAAYMDALMNSGHKDAIAMDWAVEKKRDTLVCLLVGALKEKKVFKGSYTDIAKLLNKENYRTFAKYMGQAKKHFIGKWTDDYEG